MLKQLFDLFNVSNTHHITMVMSIISNILNALNQEFANNPEGKNNAIDALRALLEGHKETANSCSQVPAVPAETPAK